MKHISIIVCFFVLPLFGLNIIKPKLCINCKYFLINNNNNELSKCSLFPKEIDNSNFLVTGIEEEKIVDYSYCSTARQFYHMCGNEGKMYENNNT